MKEKRRRKRRPDEEPEDEFVVPLESSELARTHADEQRLILYLSEDETGDAPILALVPPDLHQCQCEWPDISIQTFGPKPIVRCDQEPTVVAFQKRSKSDEHPTGAISLCHEHHIMVEHMYPHQCYFRHISPEKKIGGLVD